MKRFAIITLSILICMAATVFGQSYDQYYVAKKDGVKKGCEFNVVGTWKAEKSDEAAPIFYRFTPEARVIVLSGSGQGSEMREVASAVYTLDNPKAPKAILIKSESDGGVVAKGTTSMEIADYDDTSVTLAKPGSALTRWVRVEPYRYFIVLAGRTGTFYDDSGPTFPMMIKTDGQQTQIDAVGIYDGGGGKWAFGAIPAATCNEFMKEPSKNTEVMLRLEISGAQYERGLKIVQTWDRRARNNELLYPDLTMDNILLAKQVTETLNQCGEKFNIYNLDWSLEDHISSASPRDDNAISRIPFRYFKELKRLNKSLHVSDEKFYGRTHQMQHAAK